jgi:ATP-binding cassette, subfamily B, multidrug efflux pump
MQTNAGLFEEKKLDQSQDIKLLWQLYPYVRPYRLILFFSVIMAMGITLLDLSLPYITKTAIDLYIVPKTGAGTPHSAAARYLTVDIAGKDTAEIVQRYPELFTVLGSSAEIAYSQLHKLSPNDLKALRKHDISGISLLAVIFLGIIILDFLLNFSQQVIMEYTGQNIMHDFRMKLFRHIQDMPVSYFNRNPVARLVTRTTSDVQNMQEMFTSVIAFVFKDLFLLGGITIILIKMNWHLALISFVVLPAVGFISIHYSRQARDAFRIIRTKTAEINTHFSETITGMKVIQLFRQEANNYQKFNKTNHEYYLAGMQQVHVFAIFMPVIEILGITAVAIIIYYGGVGVLSNQITIGALTAFIAYIKMFFRPIRDIAEKYNILQNAMSSAERLFQILDNTDKDAPRIIHETGMIAGIPEEPLSAISSLNASDICFSYIKDEPVLKNVSFNLVAGDTLAVVGPTGSGKTTLMNLITRFYIPNAGCIQINGKDIQSIASEQLRDRIALVTQDPFLFSESIRENILHGAREVSGSELEKILEAANCKHIVDRLPHGLDTLLSEGGASISSGERQLVSIARAFARNPELIILDEATSYIDSQTEEKIQNALINLMTGRTAIIIAHRLSTARLADQILVMKKGRIIESGTHEALMSRKGFYYMLHQMEKID